MKNSGRILLLIDDQAELAKAAPLFSQLPEGWKAHVSENTQDALCQLDQVAVDIIFVDLKAGAFAGAQFLHEVWARHPKTIRFLLAPALEPDLMVTCALGPHQFLQKPFDLKMLQAALERAGLVDELFSVPAVKELVARIRTFPSRPAIYVEVMRELRSKDCSPQIVGELVARDLAISAKLIQITNSAFYGFSQRVTAPGDAVLLLGMETTASLVLGIEAFAWLDQVKLQYFSTDQIWRHCQVVANAALAIADFVTQDAELAHEAFTAALLHDVGKLALAVNCEEEYRGVLSEARAKNQPVSRIEKEHFGTTHAEAGACLLSLWGLSAPVIRAVARHHLPAGELTGPFSAATAVHLANAFENAETAGTSGYPDFQLDLDYPAELNFQDRIDTLRELARNCAKPSDGVTQFQRRQALEKTPITAEPAVRLAATVSPNGWWSRFRSLLAA